MRLFTFGCSYTMFLWPTWADIIATDLDIEYQNWGIPGLGNVGIQSQIAYADMKYKLTKEDLVLILWTTWNREDRYIDRNWQAGGSVFNNKFYDNQFINKYWSWENDIVKNSTAIHMTGKAYKDIIKHQASMTIFPSSYKNTDITMFLSKIFNKLISLDDDPVTKFYQTHLDMPELLSMEQHKNSMFSGRCIDPHPDILCHLSYVENTVYPNLGYTLKPSTKQMFTEIQHELTNIYSPQASMDSLQGMTMPVLAKYNIRKSTI